MSSYLLPTCIISTYIAAIAICPPSVANPAIDRIASEITVRIEGPQGGSGVILEADNNIYYVLTNAHVVSKDGDYTIITPDEKPYHVENASWVTMPGEDVAVLAFRSSIKYPTAQIGDPEAIAMGNRVYVAGWPQSGGSLRQRIFVNTEGELTHLIEGVEQTHFPLHYTNVVRVGMSGGPVLNQRGEVIGINRLVQLVDDSDRVVASGVKLNRILSWWEIAEKPIPTELEFIANSPLPSTSTPSSTLSGGGYQLVQTLTMEEGFLGAVAIAPLTSSLMASGHSDGTIIIWDLTTGKSIKSLTGHTKAVNTITMTSDGQTLISGSDDRTIKVWNLESGTLENTLTGHRDAVSALALTPNGQTLVSGGWDQQINVWNFQTNQVLQTLSGHEGLISSLAITSDGTTLISGSQDTTIRVWDLDTFQLANIFKGHRLSVLSLAVSRDGKTLASGGGEGVIHLWSLGTGELTNTFSGHTDGVWSVKVTPDGKTLVSGSWDKTIRFWDLTTSELLSTLKGHSDYVVSLSLSEDGKTLVSGGLNNEILIWTRN